MGGTQSDVSNIGIAKGEGYRILSVRPNSPLDSHVDIYFDFIIDVIPQKQPQRNPRDILQKLTDSDRRPIKTSKKLSQIWAENENNPVSLKIVSTKYRNVRTVEMTPNSNWNGSQDLMGIQTRLQRYDEAFDTFFPFSDIREGSPVKKANIKQGEFLIGCQQFKYASINELLEHVYEKFYDKSVENKTIHFAVYSLAKDELKIVPVLLARGWGDKGLLGCQFLEGQLNRFPKNLSLIREQLKIKKMKSDDGQRLRRQLLDLNGASVQLIQSIKAQKQKKKKIANLKSILMVQPSVKSPNPKMIRSEVYVRKQLQMQKSEPNQHQHRQHNQEQKQGGLQPQYVTMQKYKKLQTRVTTLQQIISNIKNQIEDMADGDDD